MAARCATASTPGNRPLCDLLLTTFWFVPPGSAVRSVMDPGHRAPLRVSWTRGGGSGPLSFSGDGADRTLAGSCRATVVGNSARYYAAGGHGPETNPGGDDCARSSARNGRTGAAGNWPLHR